MNSLLEHPRQSLKQDRNSSHSIGRYANPPREPRTTNPGHRQSLSERAFSSSEGDATPSHIFRRGRHPLLARATRPGGRSASRCQSAALEALGDPVFDDRLNGWPEDATGADAVTELSVTLVTEMRGAAARGVTPVLRREFQPGPARERLVSAGLCTDQEPATGAGRVREPGV